MPRASVFAAWALSGCLVAALAAGGCSLYRFGNEPEVDDAGANDAARDAGADDSVSDDAAIDDGGGADADADAPKSCQVGMIPTSAGCIDALEVTVEDYAVFLVAKAGNVSGQPPECAWNSSYAPQNDGGPAVAATAAVSNVDWCDAFAYCAFAGKRLCGKIGGGPVAADAAADPAQDEWFAACSHADDGQHAFPYGNVYDAATCNASSGARVAVGSFPGCVGGYPGLFDMAGNVWEWENRCLRGAAADAATDPCGTRGGGFSSGTSSTCANAQSDLRSTALEKVGFRCCAN